MKRGGFCKLVPDSCTLDCVVPENIHTPPPQKVTGNSEGEGGSKTEISEESGGFIGSSFSRG